jgi:hypothetical protein
MEMTQRDYDDRKKRVDDGTGDDEDARLVKLYESEGYQAGARQPERLTQEVPPSDPSTDTSGDGGDEGRASRTGRGRNR